MTGGAVVGESEAVVPPGYWAEPFTDEERGRLEPYVTTCDRPVFALRNLPQVTAAAVFARYSRSSKSLRRLLLDEFLDAEGGVLEVSAGGQRAHRLFERVVSEYGDDSVAQLGGVHLACEQVSQPLAKAIEWGRLGAYLEQSTRYIPYTDRRDGHYRYLRPAEVMESPWAGEWTAVMDGLFDCYTGLIDPLTDHLGAHLPGETGDRARQRALRALALDLVRGLLPAATVSNVGVFASPQALEQMVLRLRAHDLREARDYAEMIAHELREAVPDFVSRMDREDRGGVWVDYLRRRDAALTAAAAAIGGPGGDVRPAVTLVEWDRDAEERILANALMPFCDAAYADVRAHVAGLSVERRAQLFEQALGERRNRRHRPGRGFEHADYTFEIVSDYGAFRDLQRHRMLTIQWQPLTPGLGYTVPAEVEAAGLGDQWRRATDAAAALSVRLAAEMPQWASYPVTLAHRVRYVMKLNAREAMHMIELRTSPQGHPSYRAICQEMHRQIDEVAKHHLVAGSMRFVGREDVHLPRYDAERRRDPAGT